MNYYNDIEPSAVAWLKQLIADEVIPPGDVDDRSIKEVQPNDIKGYTQCHFFVGVGGWSIALELAGWGANKPVWTGSCPCQPFSVAGLGKGAEDKRHLWPEFARLICECEPPTIFGEQTPGPLGREWLSGVRLDLEAMGYAVGAADLCAAAVGGIHNRPRLWWTAYAESFRRKYPQYAESDFMPERNGANQKVSVKGILACNKRRFYKKVRSSKFIRKSNGLYGRAHLVRGYGNAIVPQVAAEFIKAFMGVKYDIQKRQ